MQDLTCRTNLQFYLRRNQQLYESYSPRSSCCTPWRNTKDAQEGQVVETERQQSMADHLNQTLGYRHEGRIRMPSARADRGRVPTRSYGRGRWKREANAAQKESRTEEIDATVSTEQVKETEYDSYYMDSACNPNYAKTDTTSTLTKTVVVVLPYGRQVPDWATQNEKYRRMETYTLT